jgi:hypothetical protein
LLAAVHAVFDVTLNAFVEAFALVVHAVSLTPNVGGDSTCVTEIVLMSDPAVNVTVAVRGVIRVCAVALSVTLRFPLPPVWFVVNHG